MATSPHPQFQYLPALFVITAKSNLHAGSGGENYGIIDKMVQRDTTSGFPCIYASSLKGALKEYFNSFGKDYQGMITYIFGNDRGANAANEKASDNNEGSSADKKSNRGTNSAGNYRFLQADLLSIPRPVPNKMFNHFTTKVVKDHFRNTLRLFEQEVTDETLVFGDNLQETNSDEEFIRWISDFELPVIARNNLVNGQSENLWYEQVLPRESKFFFLVLYPNPELGKTEAEQKTYQDYFDKFSQGLEQHIVQIGANASVGYGLCQLQQIPLQAISSTQKQEA